MEFDTVPARARVAQLLGSTTSARSLKLQDALLDQDCKAPNISAQKVNYRHTSNCWIGVGISCLAATTSTRTTVCPQVHQYRGEHCSSGGIVREGSVFDEIIFTYQLLNANLSNATCFGSPASSFGLIQACLQTRPFLPIRLLDLSPQVLYVQKMRIRNRFTSGLQM